MPPERHTSLAAIEAERERQDAQWGGNAHDDQHTVYDWFDIIGRQIEKVGAGYLKQGVKYESTPDAKARLEKIAAIALAGLESIARKEAANKPHV